MRLRFHTLDVFTDQPFGGNPLGVFPDAAHLPADLMQKIARQMNLSETVFLGPPETPDGTARVRIFTPAVEVPFAGHPTVGTALFLASRGEGERSADGRRAELVLEENVGALPVEVRFDDGRTPFARFTTAVLPEHRACEHAPADLAAMIGLDVSDVCPDGYVPESVSCGLPYLIIPVRSLRAMRSLALDTALWRSMVANDWAHHVYAVCPEAEGEDVDFHVRMFAPGSGVPEDPATGSAAAALGGYLAGVDGRADGRLSWTVEQGIECGRPSLLYVEADRAGGKTVAVRVGGRAVEVSEGTMTVPD